MAQVDATELELTGAEFYNLGDVRTCELFAVAFWKRLREMATHRTFAQDTAVIDYTGYNVMFHR